MAEEFHQFCDAMWRDLDVGALGSLSHYRGLFPGVPADRAQDEYEAIQRAAARSVAELETEYLTGVFAVPEVPATLGRYRDLVLLGRGGQAAVYRAVDPSVNDRLVALKVFEHPPRELARQIRNEVALTAAMSDGRADICQVFSVEEDAVRLILVLSHVEGQTLADHIDRARRAGRGGPVELPGEGSALTRVLRCGARLAEALHAAHTHRTPVLHRDVKPGNVMIRPDGRPVLLDFGIAIPTSETVDASPYGTPATMSPEQWCQVPDLDARTDVYSLGVTLFQALTLAAPYDAAATSRHRMETTLLRPPISARALIPGLPEDVDAVLARCLARDRRDRYPTADALRRDLEAVLEGRRPTARGSIAQRIRKGLGARPFLAFALGAVALAIVGGGLALGPGRRLLEDVRREQTLRTLRAETRDLLAVAPEGGVERAEWLGTPMQPWTGDVATPRTWLDRAQRVLEERGGLEREQAALRARAEPYAPDDAERDAAERRRRAPELHQLIRYDSDRLTELTGRLASTVDGAERTRLRRDEAAVRAGLESHLRHPAATARFTYRFAATSDRLLHEEVSDLLTALDRVAAARPAVSRILETATFAADRWRTFAAREGSGLVLAGATIEKLPGFVPLTPLADGSWDFWYALSGPLPTGEDAAPKEGPVPSPDVGLVFRVLLAGDRLLGRDDPSAPDEGPRHVVHLTPWLHARTRVSTFHASCLERSRLARGQISPVPLTGADHAPLRQNWIQATRWLEEFGLELGTEAQWEAAAASGGKRPMFVDVPGACWDWCRDGYRPTRSGPSQPGDGYRQADEAAPKVVRGPPSQDHRAPSLTYRGTLAPMAEAGVRPVRRLLP